MNFKNSHDSEAILLVEKLEHGHGIVAINMQATLVGLHVIVGSTSLSLSQVSSQFKL